MTQNRILRLLALAILCVLPACPAIVATYLDVAAWQAVTLQSAILDFTGINTGVTTSVGPLSGMTFISQFGSGELQVYSDWSWYDGDYILRSWAVPGSLHVSMSTPVTAFATQMMVTTGTPAMTVTVNSGETPLGSWTRATSAPGTRTFFGVVSTDPLVTFNSILFTPASGSAILDNVRVGSYNDPTPPVDPPPPEVPEPGTGFLVLGGVGLLALGWLRKRS
jgi:hypothetical protein